jgi:hypothetical protein
MPIRPVTKIKTESQINIPKIQYIPNESFMPSNPIEGVLYLIGEE